jgi:hypothetical protein
VSFATAKPAEASPSSAYAALGAYFAAFFLALFLVWSAHDELASGEAELSRASDRLQVLQGRRNPATATADDYGLKPRDRFLEGEKITVAAAELQRRVAREVAKAGGEVVSSRLERNVDPDKPHELKLAVDFEIAQPNLPSLLYALEASTPFLFVEKLGLRSRNDTAETGSQPRLRVALLVIGTWREPKT